MGYGGGIGSIISANDNYYYYDGIGNVVNIADGGGMVTQSFVYDAYGNILNGTIPSPHGSSTKEYSNKSGLIYFGARYYDPINGRWISKDILTWGPDDPRCIKSEDISAKVYNHFISSTGAKYPWLFLNRYTYVCNNPVNLVDHWGLWPVAPGYNPGPANAVAGAASTGGGDLGDFAWWKRADKRVEKNTRRERKLKRRVKDYYQDKGKPIPPDVDWEFDGPADQNKYLTNEPTIRNPNKPGRPPYNYDPNWP